MEELLNKIVVFEKFGDAESLKINKNPLPIPKSGEVRIKVLSIGLNRAEQLYRAGMFIDQPVSYPASLGYECSGEIDEIGGGSGGKKDSIFKIGDKVSILTCSTQAQRQTYAEYVVFPESCVVLNPDGFSHSDSSSIWMAYLTAYYAFKDISQVQPNDHVLITAGSSSAGLAAIQLAKHAFNLKVIVTSRTSTKKDQLLSYGADYFIATDECKDICSEIASITSGGSISLVYDSVGGQITNELSRTLKPQGHYILYGILSGQPTTFPLIQSFITHINFKGYIVFQYTTDPIKLKQGKDFLLNQFTTNKKYKSIVGKVYKGIESMIDAHKYLDQYNSFGKTIVEL